MTYTDYIGAIINSTAFNTPIYSIEIAEKLINKFNLNKKNASAATAVAIKRLIDDKRCEDLRCYQKGIYYRTVKTPFGETGINKEMLIQHKYLMPNIGYETGYTVLNRLGLTTQMPKERVLATNKAKNHVRIDHKLGVLICPPKVAITAENKRYLQILDIMELLDKAPVDEDKLYKVIANYIHEHNMEYDYMLSLADRYYSKNTVLQIAHTASAERKHI